jgi:DNA modification methylase
MKKPFLKLTYKIKGEQVEKWLCFASGVSCISLSWMQKHNEKHKALGSAHLEMMQQLIANKEKLLTEEPEPKSNAGNKELLERIKKLEAHNKALTEERDEYMDMAQMYERETKYVNASVKIYNELLENFYRREGFKEMYKAVEDCMNVVYNDDDNYNKETGEYNQEAIKAAEEEARALKYDYQMYLGDRPMSKEAILENFCYDNSLDISDYNY